ncbi:MAG: hypothetical protein IK048_02625 [Clostridia bacterium]|nr:hypothetical protein [Clostridia bacterium]
MYYFGTDGIRNKAEKLLADRVPYMLGKALGKNAYKILVARDVRESSLDIEKQLCLGLLEGDAKIYLAGVLPTPALAYIAQVEDADFAIMITASHNPPEYNGLKVFGKCGKKLSLDVEEKLDLSLKELGESFAKQTEVGQRTSALSGLDDASADVLTDDEAASPLKITLSKEHRIRIVEGAEYLYATHVKKMFPRFDGQKVRIDCAYGCFAELAKRIFESLGASVVAENDERDGARVNVNCGSTNIEEFAKRVKTDEIGFAFDGDGDRVLAVVNGKVYDGDAILLAISTLYRIQGKLKKKIVVGTELSNSKLQRELAFGNTALVRTPVGDKYILDALNTQNSVLGGEKSGHIIMLDKGNTGDGIVTALTLLEVKKTIGDLPSFTPYPMLDLNVSAENPAEYQKSDEFKTKMTAATTLYSKYGRFVVRPSGTEPVLRITFECFSPDNQPVFAKLKKLFCPEQR